MPLDPGTAMLIATAVASASKGGSDYLGAKRDKKAGKRRAAETERETKAGILSDSLQRSAEMEAHQLSGSKRKGKRRFQSMQDTADLLRGAFSI